MTEETQFVPYEVALKIVGNVNEEEHLTDPNRRILNVYDKQGHELCWYDADEILAEAKPANPKDVDSVKQAAVEVVMHQIPKWAVEEVLKRMEEQENPAAQCNCSSD